MNRPLETCLECECALVGSESRFCAACEDEIRAEAAEAEQPRASDIDGDAAKAFVEAVNMELNQTIHTTRVLQSLLKTFASDHDLPYVRFREDKRFSSAWGDTAKNMGGAA